MMGKQIIILGKPKVAADLFGALSFCAAWYVLTFPKIAGLQFTLTDPVGSLQTISWPEACMLALSVTAKGKRIGSTSTLRR